MLTPNKFINPCFHYTEGLPNPHDYNTCSHFIDTQETTPYEYYHHTEHPSDHTTVYEYHVCEMPYSTCPEVNCPPGPPPHVIHTTSPMEEENEPIITKKRVVAEPVKKIYDEIHAECEHFLFQKNCSECRYKLLTAEELPQIETDPNDKKIDDESAEDDEDKDIRHLAQSMMKKREQNKRAAARYREKKKNKLCSIRTEMQRLQDRNDELKKKVAEYAKAILVCRKQLGLTV